MPAVFTVETTGNREFVFDLEGDSWAAELGLLLFWPYPSTGFTLIHHGFTVSSLRLCQPVPWQKMHRSSSQSSPRI